MNYKNKQLEIKRIKNLFINNYPEGCIKWSNESLEHFLVKCQVCYYLKRNNWEVWTESYLRSFKRRVDIWAIHKSGMAIIVEISSSETRNSILLKEESTPEGIDFIKVNAKDFNYSKFKL